MSENSRVVERYSAFRSACGGVGESGNGVSQPVFIARRLRPRLKMRGKASQPPTTSTRPRSAGVSFSHSKTDGFGFGPYEFESILGSNAPVIISLYPG
jgi:hypothetical protein